jgi:hypothetical protein
VVRVTLDTRIYIHDRVSIQDVFLKLNQLLGATEATRCTVKPDSIWNEPAQGLDAWLIVSGDPHGREYRRDRAEPHDEDCEPGCGYQHPPACWLEVSLDTAYGYNGPEGSCGGLHARLIMELGQWLDSRGKEHWSWRNEFTGDIHQRYDGLDELIGDSLQAQSWFRTFVVPAIIARTGGNDGN